MTWTERVVGGIGGLLMVAHGFWNLRDGDMSLSSTQFILGGFLMWYVTPPKDRGPTNE